MAEILLADKYYIPSDLVPATRVQRAFERHVFAQAMCNRCRVYKQGQRFSELCVPCDGYKGFYKTWRDATIGDVDYYAVPSGDVAYLQEKLRIDLQEHDVLDYRSDVRAKHPLTFTGKLFTGRELRNGAPSPDQVSTLREFYLHKRGILQSPPRSGKTLMGTHIICKYKRRTLIVAHEKQLLLQFYRTLLNFTDLRQLRRETGEKIAGIIEHDRDWDEEWDYVFCTYQSFITKRGFQRVKRHVVNKFGLLEVDEVHLSSADSYTGFINKLNMKYKVGLSATPTRKDTKEFLHFQTIGPVVVKTEAAALAPEVEVIYTDFKPKRGFTGRAAYTYANQWLANNKDRRRLLVRQIFQDLRSNEKHCIMIPVLFVQQARKLAKMINDQAQYNNEHRGENWSDEVAIAYYDDKKKQQTLLLNKAREGKSVRVLIGIRRMFKVGIDVPAWTHMYLTFPMNNKEDFYQMTQRICTPYEGKPQPVLRMVVDPIPLSIGCFLATYHHINEYKYVLSEASKKIFDSIHEARTDKREAVGWNRSTDNVPIVYKPKSAPAVQPAKKRFQFFLAKRQEIDVTKSSRKRSPDPLYQVR